MKISKNPGFPMAGLVLAALLAVPGDTAASAKLEAREILSRAEAVRNPDFDRAVELNVRSLSPEGRSPQRETDLSMVTRGREGTLLLRHSPAVLKGAALMLERDAQWAISPKSKTPVQLTEGQVVFGDVQSAHLARLDLATGWDASLLGEERFEEDACYKLELKRTGGTGVYTRVLYWIEKKDFLPRRLELYGTETGRLVRMMRYEDFEKGDLGAWPKKMVIEGGNAWEEMSIARFSNPRKVEAGPLTFGAPGLVRFRDAALFAQDHVAKGEVSIENVLTALASSAAPASSPAPSPKK